MKVTVAPDFEGLLPPHSAEELAQLEANCLADPQHEQMPPVHLWGNHNNTILDGHNQYRIREKHRLKTKFVKLNFETRDEAMRHALNVQFGRRNSDASQRAMAYAKLPHRNGPGRPADNSANLPNITDLAKSAGVSERTMTSAVAVFDKAAPQLQKAVETGEVKASDAAAILELTPSQQVKALKAKRSGKAKTVRQAATDFDPAKFTKTKPGTQKRKPTDRKEAFQLLGKLIRVLDRLRLSDEAETHLRAINQIIKDAA